MPHTYASVDELKRWLVEGGTDYGTASDAELLGVLEGASRRVDAACGRSRFGTGFGPRIGTNLYDGDGAGDLDLSDDLIAFTSGTVAGSTGGTTSAITETTDFYLDNGFGHYASPYRRLAFNGLSSAAPAYGLRSWSLTGKWGYADERVVATTAAETMDASETGYDVTSGSAFSIGQTLLADSEQMYVTGVSSNTLTVVRGANGTTAATHLTAISLEVYRYHRSVVTATLMIAQRRWRSKEAGLTGDFGGEGIPGASLRDSERSIIWNVLADVRLLHA